VASAVFRILMRAMFPLGDFDAKKLEDDSRFNAKELQKPGGAICRMERAEYDFNQNTGSFRRSAGSAAVEGASSHIA